MLAWFGAGRFPLYLAPMAGVTDVIFRGLCKELGADVMVTEFVSAEGIMQADARTRKYNIATIPRKLPRVGKRKAQSGCMWSISMARLAKLR